MSGFALDHYHWMMLILARASLILARASDFGAVAEPETMHSKGSVAMPAPVAHTAVDRTETAVESAAAGSAAAGSAAAGSGSAATAGSAAGSGSATAGSQPESCSTVALAAGAVLSTVHSD